MNFSICKTHPLSFWFVKTSQRNPRHHELHDNHSPFVVCTNPNPGDQIVYALHGEYSETWNQSGDKIAGEAELSLLSYTETSSMDQVKLMVLSNPGRSPFLGEDGLEDAYGHEQLAILWLECLNGCEWSYAPCDVETIEEPSKEPEKDNWWRWFFDDKLKAAWNPEHGWQLVDASLELEETINRCKLED